MLDMFKKGGLKVYDEAGNELAGTGALENLMKNGSKIKFTKKAPNGQWLPGRSEAKSVFPKDWGVDEIAEAGKQFSNSRYKDEFGKWYADVTVNGKTIKVQGFIDSDNITSWFPVFD